jgi:hypothetical protein
MTILKRGEKTRLREIKRARNRKERERLGLNTPYIATPEGQAEQIRKIVAEEARAAAGGALLMGLVILAVVHFW